MHDVCFLHLGGQVRYETKPDCVSECDAVFGKSLRACNFVSILELDLAVICHCLFLTFSVPVISLFCLSFSCQL